MDWGTLGAMAALLFGAIGLQSFWIARELDGIKADVNGRFGEIKADVNRGFGEIKADVNGRFGEIKTSLDRIETALLGLDRRVTRLEERL